MKLSDFDFHIPEHLVAQFPLENRASSKMLVLHRGSGKIEHRHFSDLPEYLNASDLLIFNQSKVVKARLLAQRASGGKVEIFLLKKIKKDIYECLVKATASRKIGLEFSIAEKFFGKIICAGSEPMLFQVELRSELGSVEEQIEIYGKVPLPPYIHREAVLEDAKRYQTVYASSPGSVAAPTAGLHFTPPMLEKISDIGVDRDFVTLHVGLGTFQPIKVENILEHKMHKEEFHISDALLEKCRLAKANGRRVIAVGTTTVRALESAARGKTEVTDIFLKPGDSFYWVDCMLTNFHQPKSSLVVMLSAFIGDKSLLLEAYKEAVKNEYRFFSYGDCMLVLK